MTTTAPTNGADTARAAEAERQARNVAAQFPAAGSARRYGMGGRAAPAEPLGHKATDAAIAKYRDLSAELRATTRRVRELLEGRKAAEAADDQAAADAIRAGKPDPGRPAAEAHHAELEAAQRRRAILDRATSDQLSEVSQLLDANRPALAAKLDAEVDEATTRLLAAADALASADAALGAAAARRGWLDTWPKVGAEPLAARPVRLEVPTGGPLTAARIAETIRGTYRTAETDEAAA